MSKHIIHKHSSVANKQPAPDILDYGEIAINYAAGAEKISIKNTENEVVEFIPSSQGVGMRTAEGGEIFNSYDTGANAASALYSHAEGHATSATARCTHAEGTRVWASGITSHAEGNMTHAMGVAAHSEGLFTYAMGAGSHAEGRGTSGIGVSSHVEGSGTIAYNTAEHACGKFNFSIPESADTTYSGSIFTVGVGKSPSDRKNAIMVDSTGGVYFYGLGNYDGTDAIQRSTSMVPKPPAMNLSGVLSSLYDELQAEIQSLQARIEQLTPLKYSLNAIVRNFYAGIKSNNFNTSGNNRKYETSTTMTAAVFDNILAACQSGRPVIITGVITGSAWNYKDSCVSNELEMTAACTVASYSYLSGSSPVLTLTLTLPPVEIEDCNATTTAKTISTRTVAGFLILRRGDVATYYMADIG